MKTIKGSINEARAWERGWPCCSAQPVMLLFSVVLKLGHVHTCTVPLTSNLSVHACPLASDSKAARVRRPRYSRVNIRAHASAIHVTRVCTLVTSARSTHECSVYTQASPTPKESGGLGYEASVSIARESRARVQA